MWQSSALSPNDEAGSPQERPLSDVMFTQPLHGEFYIENTDVLNSQIYLGYLFNILGVLYLSEHDPWELFCTIETDVIPDVVLPDYLKV